MLFWIYLLFNTCRGLQNLVLFPSFSLPVVNFEDLASLDSSVSLLTSNNLLTIGALQIKGIPNFAAAKKIALNNVAECMRREDNIFQRIMNDGSIRRTIDGKSTQGIAESMSSNCGDPAKMLRALVDLATKQLFLVLDTQSNSKSLLSPYKSFSDLMMKGDHLEHIHSYYGSNMPDKLDNPTIELHTDAGLLIAMTTGFYTNIETEKSNGLYIKMPSGSIAHVNADDDALIIMVGSGGSMLLEPVLGGPLHAVPHMLQLRMPQGAARSWYGKMFLPPSNAIMSSKNNMTFKNYREKENQYLHRKLSSHSESTHSYHDDEASNFIPLACEGVSVLTTNTLCMVNGNPGVFCWSSCQDVSALPCGQQALCIDTVTGNEVDGEKMCTSSAGMKYCELQCPTVPPPAYNGSSEGFCIGAGVTMFMDGFHSMQETTTPLCVNILFVDWTLDNKEKFAAGCVGVFSLGILIQFLTSIRVKITTDYLKSRKSYLLVPIMILYFAQVMLSYYAMLIAMSYSYELFFMVVAGLTVGYACFNLFHSTPPASTDPCCPDEIEEKKTKKIAPMASRPYQSLNEQLLKGGSSEEEEQMVSCCGPNLDDAHEP